MARRPPALQSRQVDAVKLDGARIRIDQPQEAAGEGGLARAGGARQRQGLATPDGQVDALQRNRSLAATSEALAEPGYLEQAAPYPFFVSPGRRIAKVCGSISGSRVVCGVSSPSLVASNARV